MINIDHRIMQLNRKASVLLGSNAELVKKHLSPAIRNIITELENNKMQDHGCVDVPTSIHLADLFKDIMIDHMEGYVEWLAEKFIVQFQNILNKKILDVSHKLTLEYIKNKSLSKKQIENIFQPKDDSRAEKYFDT